MPLSERALLKVAGNRSYLRVGPGQAGLHRGAWLDVRIADELRFPPLPGSITIFPRCADEWDIDSAVAAGLSNPDDDGCAAPGW